jgi:hypothetical protein
VTSRFRFISTRRASYGVKRLCRVLGVSRSGFYRWEAAEPDRQARAAADDDLATEIAAIHAASHGSYGSPRVPRYQRGFGLSEVLFDPAQSETEILLAAARKLALLPGQESRVKYVSRARTVRSPSPCPLSPLQEVRRALGFGAAQTFAVTDAACASLLAGMLLSAEPDEEALALVLVGEKAFGRQT